MNLLRWILIRLWWARQPSRWTKHDEKGRLYIDGNVEDRLTNIELRRKLAPMMQSLLPEYGTCQHCHWPWALGKGHTLNLTKGHGCFAVCEHCWDWLRGHSGGDETIRKCFHVSRVQCWPDTTKEQLDEALDKALGTNRS